MIKPCENTEIYFDDRGYQKTRKTYSYVSVLTEKNGFNVMAVRSDGFERKTHVYKVLAEQYPDWNIKSTNKLYEEDFSCGR